MKVIIQPYIREEGAGRRYYEALVTNADCENPRNLMIGGLENTPIDELLTGLANYLGELGRNGDKIEGLVVFRTLHGVSDRAGLRGEYFQMGDEEYGMVVETALRHS